MSCYVTCNVTSCSYPKINTKINIYATDEVASAGVFIKKIDE